MAIPFWSAPDRNFIQTDIPFGVNKRSSLLWVALEFDLGVCSYRGSDLHLPSGFLSPRQDDCDQLGKKRLCESYPQVNSSFTGPQRFSPIPSCRRRRQRTLRRAPSSARIESCF